ncbi:cytochrome b/b6 domain-containing protein [Pseudarthrobacter sp. H2]|uniref:cytochrome b/b6 domain-containing protein n=1 Tax=Pseudarthrobacter sp. H2 TaxID=3418415 RepID=UPI003CE81BAD
MVLIIRSGWQVRTQRRPPATWTARWGKSPKKISINLWLHQSLDILWLANGAIFVLLLIATGQWMRIVPTSWEVFPNALSSALQYASLDWPTENGWVNYNSLQVLAYFVTIFVAAPLAAITGFRMSGAWPGKAERPSKGYPIEVARAIHLPVMFYFVGFTIVHVALVLSTGALRNLNHMYGRAGRGQLVRILDLLRLVVGDCRRLACSSSAGSCSHCLAFWQGGSIDRSYSSNIPKPQVPRIPRNLRLAPSWPLHGRPWPVPGNVLANRMASSR